MHVHDQAAVVPCFLASQLFSTGAAAPSADELFPSCLLCGASHRVTTPRPVPTPSQVYSAFRLVKRAADAGKTVVVVNLGDTRAERSGLDVLKASLTTAGVEE